MRIIRFLDHHDAWLRNSAGHMVEVRHHLGQFFLLAGGSAVAEEGLIRRTTIDRDRLLLLRIRRKSAAILVRVFVARRLVHVPDAAVAISALSRRCERDAAGDDRSEQCKDEMKLLRHSRTPGTKPAAQAT